MISDSFGTGTIVADLQHAGTQDAVNVILLMVVANSTAQSLSTQPSTPSGPATFLGLMLFRQGLTSWVLRTGLESLQTPYYLLSKRAEKLFSSSAKVAQGKVVDFCPLL